MLAELKTQDTSDRKRFSGIIDMTCNPKCVHIKCVDGSSIRGKVNMKHQKRLSDFFINEEQDFFVVFDATVTGQPGKSLVDNKKGIVWVCLEN